VSNRVKSIQEDIENIAFESKIDLKALNTYGIDTVYRFV